MAFFKKTIKEVENEETIMIGAHVPITISEYLTLFSTADGKSKSAIIRPAIEAWYKEARKKFSEKELIKIVAERGWQAWKQRSSKSQPFAVVMNIQRRELAKKKLSKKTIDKIIQKIENVKSKEKGKPGRPSKS